MEFVINGVKCIFGGIKDGDTFRPLNEAEKDKIAKAVAQSVLGRPRPEFSESR
jgi:hypothetical protein